MLGGELSFVFDVGAGGADVACGAGALSFVGKELKFDADGEGLFESHALWGLGVEHDAAVEVYVVGGVGHHCAFEFVIHTQDVVRVGKVAVEVTELFVEGGVFVVTAFEDAVLDSEGVVGVFPEGTAGDFGGPAGKVLAIEYADPAFFGG